MAQEKKGSHNSINRKLEIPISVGMVLDDGLNTIHMNICIYMCMFKVCVQSDPERSIMRYNMYIGNEV